MFKEKAKNVIWGGGEGLELSFVVDVRKEGVFESNGLLCPRPSPEVTEEFATGTWVRK